MGPWTVGKSQPLAANERGQYQFWHVLGQWCDGRQDEGGWPAKKHSDRQRVAARLRDVIVESAALSDLPVHAGRPLTVDVQPVHPEVVAAAVGMLRKHQREGDERTAVVGPCRQCRQPFEMDVVGDDLGDRAAPALLQADLH